MKKKTVKNTKKARSSAAHGSPSLPSSAESARPRRWAVAAYRSGKWLVLPGRYETESGARLTSEFASLGGKVLVMEVVAGPDKPLAAPDAHTTANAELSDSRPL
jgi:hypothetical protein